MRNRKVLLGITDCHARRRPCTGAQGSGASPGRKQWGWTEGAIWRARSASLNGRLGAEPAAGSRGRAPGQGVRGRSPPSKAESILPLDHPNTTQTKGKICHFSLVFLKLPVSQKIVVEMDIVNFLPWSRFLIIVSSPACIENRNHFRTHRDQILIGSLVNI